MQFKEVVPFCLNSNVLIGSRHLKEGEKHESSFCLLGLYLPTKLKVAHDKKIFFLRHHLFVMTLLNFSCYSPRRSAIESSVHIQPNVLE